MKNFKKPEQIGYRSGKSNMSTFNCLNPDNTDVKLHNREWINPARPDFKEENKQVVKSIVQMNKEKVKAMKVEKIIQGK